MCDSMAEVSQASVKTWMWLEVDSVDNATQLAENAAHEFGRDDWLDDETHYVWDLAIDVMMGAND